MIETKKSGTDLAPLFAHSMMRFSVSFQPQKRAVASGDSLADWRALLEAIERLDSVQVSVEKWADGEFEAGLNAYFNANRAWVIWGNPDGEWLYPVNPNWRELKFDVEECFIENGQLDEYDIRWSTPKAEATKLLQHYFEHGTLATWLHWTDGQYWE